MHQFITIEDIKLAYRTVNSNQPDTIFFIHGNSSSAQTWAQQLDNQIFAEYRLIALELPAHGKSAASADPEKQYGLADLGRIMALAINSLAQDRQYLVIGCSLGTNILCEALAHIQPKGIGLIAPCIVGGEYSFSSISNPMVDTRAIFSDDPAEEELLLFYANSVFKNNTEVLMALQADFKKVQPPFRSVMFHQSIMGGRLSDEILLLQKSGVPVLVVFGQEEKIINPDYLDTAGLKTWRNIIYKIPEAGHLLHLDQPEIFNQLLADYARDIFTEPRVG